MTPTSPLCNPLLPSPAKPPINEAQTHCRQRSVRDKHALGSHTLACPSERNRARLCDFPSISQCDQLQITLMSQKTLKSPVFDLEDTTRLQCTRYLCPAPQDTCISHRVLLHHCHLHTANHQHAGDASAQCCSSPCPRRSGGRGPSPVW